MEFTLLVVMRLSPYLRYYGFHLVGGNETVALLALLWVHLAGGNEAGALLALLCVHLAGGNEAGALLALLWVSPGWWR